ARGGHRCLAPGVSRAHHHNVVMFGKSHPKAILVEPAVPKAGDPAKTGIPSHAARLSSRDSHPRNRTGMLVLAPFGEPLRVGQSESDMPRDRLLGVSRAPESWS
ncbi:MAG TPA: hypothetical protein VGM27_16345, partial [Acidobacteriaceae bacterium]